MRQKIQTYWSNQTRAHHRAETDQFYRLHGAELSLLTGRVSGRAVLDLGCGDGALYGPLGFAHTSRYLGVDFSASMLQAFRLRHPEAALLQGDAVDIPSTELFDVVFSSQLTQYLEREEFIDHLRSVKARLGHQGRYVCASIPAREHRRSYLRGAAVFPPNRRLSKIVKEHVRAVLGRPTLGVWYSLQDIETAARSAGLEAYVFGSLCYLYRYHAVFSMPGTAFEVLFP